VGTISHHGGLVPPTLSTLSPSLVVALSQPSPSTSSLCLEQPDCPTVQLGCKAREHLSAGKNHEEHQSETCIEIQNSDEVVNRANVPVKEQTEQPSTRITSDILSDLIAYFSWSRWYEIAYPEAFAWRSEDRKAAAPIVESKRKACRWFGVCGLPHPRFARLHPQSEESGSRSETTITSDDDIEWQDARLEPDEKQNTWNKSEKALRQIPDYIMEYAPLVHLFSGEQYWPCDMADHLVHTTPELNYTPMASESSHPTLKNLNEYNQYQRGRWVFLTSNDDPEGHPSWLGGDKNIPSIPDDPGDSFADNDGWVHHPGRTYAQGLRDAVSDLTDWFTPDDQDSHDDGIEDPATVAKSHANVFKDSARTLQQELKRQESSSIEPHRIRGGRSDAPAVLIVVDKGHGIVDAFWFFFYSFNLGNSVFNVRFGNHVGDWEHTAIRFHKGHPKAVFFSEHNFGSAYSYEAVEKIGKRPVIYSAVGTHAMYATSGSHPYVLPWGILHDQTDRGPLWDPALNSHMYTYDHQQDILRSSNFTPQAPTQWFHFAGHWGDKFYPFADKRQYRFAGQYHYVNGPLGPKFKRLGRKKICGGPDSAPCVIKHWLGGEQ